MYLQYAHVVYIWVSNWSMTQLCIEKWLQSKENIISSMRMWRNIDNNSLHQRHIFSIGGLFKYKKQKVNNIFFNVSKDICWALICEKDQKLWI